MNDTFIGYSIRSKFQKVSLNSDFFLFKPISSLTKKSLETDVWASKYFENHRVVGNVELVYTNFVWDRTLEYEFES